MNFFIDEMGTVKIGDFGLSRETVKNKIEELNEDCEGLQNRGGIEHAQSITAGVGTRCYTSPEQMNGSDYDASTNVYSLGIILFELCYSMNTVSFPN
jgi:serine/threonine protein kinase